MQRPGVFRNNPLQVSGVDHEEYRSKDRSLWYTADDINKIRALPGQVRVEPCHCCSVIDAKGDPQPLQLNSVINSVERRGEVE